MTVVDLDGNISGWHLTGHIAKGRLQNKSSLHLTARKLLSDKFPTLQILEEVPIQVRKGETLYLDFYLPLIKTCIEIHGEQHFKFVAFYHIDRMGFLKSKKRDADKAEWCARNNIKYLSLAYDNTNEWKDIIDNV